MLKSKLLTHPQIASACKGRPTIFTEDEKEWLQLFVTRDKRTQQLVWEEIIKEIGYNCSVCTLHDSMVSMGYHRWVPRRKWVKINYINLYSTLIYGRFGVQEQNKIKQVWWCQESLHWTYSDWLQTGWTDESTFNTVGFGHWPWVNCWPDEEYHPDCIDKKWESGRKSVMIWECFVVT